ncbi:hypothetical protein [Legionella brunensis]|uniref:Ubiquitin conjugation factor E4 family domain protein (U-box) n=1 Tax=Legionella brunensis TaxID=29422 RepID=A0A0W0SSV7_9GAMM|nr:hypothetical protein [Legionella brunensis]KTC86432.1 Ubiquitin conjugation factor E4 family domain protein (U-box) [Legionella brunensis]
MLEKFEQPQEQENVIYIHKKMNEQQAKILLVACAEKAAKQQGENLPDKHKLWLLRDSSVPGLITFESIVYNKSSDQWVIQTPTRYMNSKQGWVINNKSSQSVEFAQIVERSGGKEGIDSVLIESLVIHILETKNCSFENHITPFWEEKKKVVAQDCHKEKGEDFSLPSYIANLLICPLTKEKKLETGLHKTLPLMKDPVVLKDDGRTYEREVLVAQYKELDIDLKEGVHYYSNIVLRNIISHLVSQKQSPIELDKIDEELIDSLSFEHFDNAVISPSGNSFSKREITKYINSKKIGLMEPVAADPLNPNITIGKMDLIHNENLELFVRFWPDFYKSMSPENILK